MHKPTPHICNGQYRKHKLQFYKKKFMEDKVTIQKENLLSAYKEASEEQKALLEDLFGKETFQLITERVKTFGDAFKILGDEHPLTVQYNLIIKASKGGDLTFDLIAYLKLSIICAALNERWEPTLSKDEYRFYPWFSIYTKEEYDNLDESDKEYSIPLQSNNHTSGYLVYTSAYYAGEASGPYLGVPIVLRTRELADYCGKQFIDIWADFLVGYEKIKY